MRIGVYGGTFDPVHIAHLVLAEQCREQARLDRVLFVPAARPPHKLDRALTPFDRRFEMLELAVSGYPVFQVSSLEKDRPGPSFTADTLQQLHAEQENAELFLLVGSDCLPDLPYWHEPEKIASLATLLITMRPGWTSLGEPPAPFRFQRIDAPLMEISSSDLRRRVHSGKSIRYLVPRAVECYIETHKLYQ